MSADNSCVENKLTPTTELCVVLQRRLQVATSKQPARLDVPHCELLGT